MDELSKRRLEKSNETQCLIEEIYEYITGKVWARPKIFDSEYCYWDSRKKRYRLKEGVPQELLVELLDFIVDHEK